MIIGGELKLHIEPLSENNLREAINLAKVVFDDFPELAFKASLDRQKYKNFLEEGDIRLLRYWTGLHAQKVVGTTGLYTQRIDYKEAAWVGWFCVHPNYREEGFGTALLDFTIKETQRRAKKYLRLYTGIEDVEAHRLYQKKGFIDVGQEKHNDELIIFKELSL